jgi:hypothetical protein
MSVADGAPTGSRPASETAALRFLAETPLGTRVVVRSRLLARRDPAVLDGTGAPTQTDAVGYLRARTATDVTIETKSALRTIALADVTLAKQVPPPPPPRPIPARTQ